ncbi:MAG: aspartate/glutamate racemase family protein [Burkholderiaceae bacterium]
MAESGATDSPLRLLLINPNTSTHITDRLAASARAAMADDEHLTAVTAPDGPAAVRSADDLHRAEASALDLARVHAAGHDAIVLGISLDGAAARLRILHAGLPIVGMTEAALLTACLRSDRIGLLTLGPALLPLYRDRVDQIGIGSRVIAYEGPELVAAFEAGSGGIDHVVLGVLVEAGERLRDAGAESIVLAGAVLCGYAEALAVRCHLPVFDGVSCAVGKIRNLLNRPIGTAPA